MPGGGTARRPVSASAAPDPRSSPGARPVTRRAAGSAPAGAVASADPDTSTTMLVGISTIAVVPPYGDRRSDTRTPCRAASFAPTNRPSRSALARSKSGGWASC